VSADRLLALGPRIEVADGATLHPFVVADPPRPSAAAALRTRWIEFERLDGERMAPAVARSVHRALARIAIPQQVPEPLFAWFESRRGELPWRRTRDPYAVLVCEVMSQQTQIERVRTYWQEGIARWATVPAPGGGALGDG